MATIKSPFSEDLLYFCVECGKEMDEELKREEESREQAQRDEAVRLIRQSCQIGKRFESATFENYQPCNANSLAIHGVCSAYADTFSEHANKDGGGLLLLGKPGTGKNHLSAAICNHIMDHQFSTLHTTVLKLVRRIKNTWSKDSNESETEAIKFFRLPDLLVIDEVGVQFGSQAEQLLLTEVINDRYEWMRPTILISNLTTEQLSEVLGERIIDRFRENGKLLVFDWMSYRSNKK